MKRTLTFLLALVTLFALLSGCAGQTSAEPSAQPSADAAPEAALSEAPAEPSPAESPAEGILEDAKIDREGDPNADISAISQQDELPEIALPLTSDDITFSYWTALQPFFMQLQDFDLSTATYFTEIQKRTGIKLDIYAYHQNVSTEKFNLMIASNELCDLINGFSYTGGDDVAIEDESLIIDLLPSLSDKMPYYQRALNLDDTFWLKSLTDNGHLAAANCLFTVKEPMTGGTTVRTDFLDKLEMEPPETYDQLEAYFEGVKTTLGYTHFYKPNYTGVDGGSVLTSGYEATGITVTRDDAYLFKDGQAIFSPYTDNYREYLEMMARWYGAGYIDPDYIVASYFMNVLPQLEENKAALCSVDRGMITLVEIQSEGRYDLTPIPNLRKTADQQLHIGKEGTDFLKGVSISTACQYPELAMAMLDYNYSPDGITLTNYGVEGEGFVYDAEGNPQLTELVTNNPDYSEIIALSIYTNYGGSMCYIGDRTEVAYEEHIRQASVTWRENNDYSYNSPANATIAAADSEFFSSAMGDIKTYVTEMTNKFICGEVELTDSVWDEYQKTIEGMGLERCNGIKQASIETYYDRLSNLDEIRGQ